MNKTIEKLAKRLEVRISLEKNTGITPDEVRKINQVNYISVLSSLNMLGYVVVYMLLDFSLFSPAIYFLLIASALNFAIIWINKKGKHQLAKLLLAILTPFFMLYIAAIAFGKAPGFQVYLFVAAIIPLFLWNIRSEKITIVIIALTILAYSFVEFAPPIVTPLIELPQNYIYAFRLTNVFFCFTVVGIAVLIHFWLFKKMEKQLLIQTEKLKLTQQQKDRIYSIIAHDLRGPIGNFKGLTEIFIKNYNEHSMDKILELMKAMHKTSGSIQNLLENLLEWSVIQTGKKEKSLKNIRLGKIVENALEIHKDIIESKQQNVSLNIDKNIKIYADRNMVSTLLRNLISNALKFTRKKGNISISAKEVQSKVEVCVADSGLGLSGTELENLFDFQKVNQINPYSKEKGSGLGLLLCKEFVEEHDGKLWVESEVGKGSRFYFTLPRSE